MPPVVVFDLGHTGRTGGRRGARHGDYDEADIVRRYVAHAATQLERIGVTVEILGFGSYGSRQRAALQAGASAYISCHINSGWKPGFGPSVFVQGSALGGNRLAHTLSEEVIAALGQCRIHATSADDWTLRAHALIAQTGRVPAVVYEPVFIDNPAHADYCERPELIGKMLADGVAQFLGLG